ncbi:MAG: hypothetical protein JNL48_00605 [Acidobacteria bacterium]|nr:hypothetical protein [Acidobacteriota bacterium]
MKIVTTLLTAVSILALCGFVFQQAVVEGGFGPAALVGTVALAGLALMFATLTYLTSTRHRELVAKVMLAFFSTAASYLVLDLVAGWILIVPLSPPLVPDTFRHHALLPDSYAEIRQRDFVYLQRVNHLGLRGRETTVEKPAGTRRILMLGDSFTMAKGVQEDETFSVLVEQALQAPMQACGGGRVEVLNAGVDSYSPLLEYLYFKRDLARLNPDLVVLNFDNSDLIQEAAYRRQATRDATGEITAVPQIWQDSVYERFLSWTNRHLFITRAVLVYITRAMNHNEMTVRRVVNEAGREHFAHTLEGDVDRTRQWDAVFDSLHRLKTLTDQAGIPLLLTTYPWAHQVGDTGWVPGRFSFMQPGERPSTVSRDTIRARSAEMQLEVFEALPAFKAYSGTEPLYFDYDPHWNAAGHRVMANALERHIASRYLPAWCQSSAKAPQ